MYYPYLRAKQNELIMLRENAGLIAQADIHPIIEPVRNNLNPLIKALVALLDNNCNFSIILNPNCGDFEHGNEELIHRLNEEEILSKANVNLALILDNNMSLEDVETFLNQYPDKKITLIHYRFELGRELAELLSGSLQSFTHIFIEKHHKKRYRKMFRSDTSKRVLINDGFNKMPNSKYPKQEHFSELHIMYEEEGMNGFGDFLINGDEYSESGGPAYAVAIHLTYIDKDDDHDMFIKHYVSNRKDSPADPGGKFLEALEKLTNDNDENIFKSSAYKEFHKLANRQHFPGLGYVKKLSMQHHIELIADFLS